VFRVVFCIAVVVYVLDFFIAGIWKDNLIHIGALVGVHLVNHGSQQDFQKLWIASFNEKLFVDLYIPFIFYIFGMVAPGEVDDLDGLLVLLQFLLLHIWGLGFIVGHLKYCLRQYALHQV